ncbi:MAG: MBL fold metallo-hydrolase [Candidatus Puniceispirillaceae bacterium]
MTQSDLTITILGCGTSVGVPALGRAGWGACDPTNSKNRRMRCALLVQTSTTTILVDAGPDIRNQLLPHQLSKIDALLITHTHSDHIAGLDDVRTYYWPDRIKIPVYATAHHGSDIVTRFPYLFTKLETSPSYFEPPLDMHDIAAGQSLQIGDVTIDIMHQDHGNATSLGFLFNGVCGYSTDVVDMPDENFEKLSGVDLWIVEALREQTHQAHSHLAQTLDWISRVQPKQAYLTHLGLESDYDEVEKMTPSHVSPAFDGLQITLKVK